MLLHQAFCSSKYLICVRKRTPEQPIDLYRLLAARQVFEGVGARYVFYRLAIGFRVGIHEVVERHAGLLGRQGQVAAAGKLDAVFVVGPEKVVALIGVLAASEASTGTQPVCLVKNSAQQW
jgi:hypothetical protein